MIKNYTKVSGAKEEIHEQVLKNWVDEGKRMAFCHCPEVSLYNACRERIGEAVLSGKEYQIMQTIYYMVRSFIENCNALEVKE